jgi:D-aminopeptidase
VQSNFGHQLKILGIPVTRELKQIDATVSEPPETGSCMIVVATDAPLSSRNLARLARRTFIGMGRTSDVFSNGSGDYAIAFSTAYRIPHREPTGKVTNPPLVHNDTMTVLFRAVEEATEEAIYNSLFAAKPIKGHKGRRVDALPLDQVKDLLKKYLMLDLNKRLTWRPYAQD